MTSLIQPLFDGPLDIVGDVHGEIDALRSLIERLGYDARGRHPQGRRMVLVGDLTDRGPDSPKVIDVVARLIDAGAAQCVLGNHDFNILIDHRKRENRWFRGEIDEHGNREQELADDRIREQTLALFASLPLALERADLRIAHAYWNPAAIELARAAKDVRALYEEHRQRIEREISHIEIDDTEKALRHQNDNPVKLLTSGPEERSDEPTERDGKTHHEKRVIWWNDYRETFCVFGHYSISDGQPRGGDFKTSKAFCIDYGVGQRWKERRDGRAKDYAFKLAALRLPESEIIFDPLAAAHTPGRDTN